MRAREKGSSPERVEGSSRAMLATARPSCTCLSSRYLVRPQLSCSAQPHRAQRVRPRFNISTRKTAASTDANDYFNVSSWWSWCQEKSRKKIDYLFYFRCLSKHRFHCATCWLQTCIPRKTTCVNWRKCECENNNIRQQNTALYHFTNDIIVVILSFCTA